MGRRINISQPTVINTELVPLTDSFALEPNGQTEQWYYENDGTYAPDRRIVPLVITPKLSAFDKDTNQTYTPNISTIAWYASQWTNGKWVEAEITNISDASQDYYIRQDKALQVSKNLSDAAHGVTIRCIATFIDPRDAGITYTEEDTIQLTANKDATVFYPEVDILNETTVTFNPLVDENSHKVFKGKIDWTTITRLNPDIAEYYANPSGTEQMLPDNATDVTSLSPILDIRYGRGATVSWNQLFTYRQTANGTISGSERTLTWNQLVQNGDFSDGLTGWGIGSGGASYVEVEDEVLRMHGASGRLVRVYQVITGLNEQHKYYCSAKVWSKKTQSNTGISIQLGGKLVGGIETSPTPLRASGIVGELSDPSAQLSLFAHVPNGASADSFFVDNVMLVDLTLMYGAGYEPTSTEQFEYDFQEIFGMGIEYKPYNEGETIRIPSITDNTASVRRIQGQSVVWNQEVVPTIPVDMNGVTFSNHDSYFVANGNPTSSFHVYETSFAVVVGHKYYYSAYVENMPQNTSETACLQIYDNTNQRVRASLVSKDAAGTGRKYLKGIFGQPSTSNTTRIRARLDSSLTYSDTKYSQAIVIDLTLMFGAGNEPETVEEFEAWLAANVGLRDYYPYNIGTILGVKCTGIKTTGFNQWDEEWENGAISSSTGANYPDSTRIRTKNYIPILSSTPYYIKMGSYTGTLGTIVYYDANKNMVGSYAPNAERRITTRADARYMRIAFYPSYGSTYNHDICVNISDPNKNGTYEPYFESTSPMEVTTMKGKLNGQGISTIVFPYGMNQVGDIYDEIYVEDNTLKAVKRLGVVDLGTQTWTLQTSGQKTPYFWFYLLDLPSVTYNNNLCCSKYIYDNQLSADKTFNATAYINYRQVNFKDSAYSDAATFKTAMSGVMLVYELATPEEYVLDPTVDARYFEWYGVKNGAEVKIDTLPCYVSGQGTDTLTIDAMFGENIPVVLRAKIYPWSDSLYPSKAYRNMAWRIPNIDAIVASDRGQAVHSDNDGGYEFDTIINIKKAILDEETKNKHLRFKWWMRNTRNNQAVETSVGWGSQVGIGVEDLRNVRGANNSLASTPVYNEVMLLGAYEEVSYTSGNATEYVTYNGVQLFGRTLE